MVDAIRNVEKALGGAMLELTEKVKKSRKFAKSLFAVAPSKAGELVTEENVKSIRPSNGLHPKYLENVLGKKAKVDIEKGTPLDWNLFE